jgi:hypothetical protein
LKRLIVVVIVVHVKGEFLVNFVRAKERRHNNGTQPTLIGI